MLLAVVQRLVNQTVARSGQGAAFSRLAGRRLALTLAPLGQTWVLVPHVDSICLSRGDAATAECHLQVDSRAWVLLHDPRQLGPLLEQGAITLRGDAELAAAVARALKACGITGEELLAAGIGDAPAHLLARGTRNLLDSGQRHAGQLSADLGSWLRDELRLVVARGEWRHTAAAINTVAADVDALEQRLARLAGARP